MNDESLHQLRLRNRILLGQGTDQLVFEANVNGANALHPNGGILMSLSAGDIVRCYNRGQAFTCGRHHSWWQGYLVG